MHALFSKLFGTKETGEKRSLFPRRAAGESHEPKVKDVSAAEKLMEKIKQALPDSLKGGKSVTLGVHTVHLRHVQTVDKSVPRIEPNLKLRRRDKKPFLNEIVKPRQLKKTTGTRDRSAPNLAEFRTNYRVQRYDRKPLLAEIRKGKQLRHVEWVNDRSAPRIRSSRNRGGLYARKPFLSEIESGHFRLRRVTETPKHVGAPMLPRRGEYKHKRSDIKPLLEEIRRGYKLRHITQINDKSSPLFYIQRGEFKTKKLNRKALLEEIRRGKQLRHSTNTYDRSRPKLPSMRGEWRWEFSQRKLGFLKDIQQFDYKRLRHVATNDKSRPILPSYGFRLRKPTDRRSLLSDVQKGVPLKKTQTLEYVAAIPKSEFKLKHSERESLLKEVKRGVPLKRAQTFDKSGPLFTERLSMRAM